MGTFADYKTYEIFTNLAILDDLVTVYYIYAGTFLIISSQGFILACCACSDISMLV